MADIVISVMVSVLTLIVCCGYLKFKQIKNNKNIKSVLPKNYKEVFFGAGMILSVILVLIMLLCVYDVSWIFAVKRIVFCATLWPIALVDYRQHIIPNKILLILLVSRAVIAVCEFVSNPKSAITELLSGLIASVAILVVLCLTRLLIKDGVGFGDIKLFAVLGLFFGIQGAVSAIFMSFVMSFLASVFLLVSKRKNKKEQIAFGPSILAGTVLSVVLFGA